MTEPERPHEDALRLGPHLRRCGILLFVNLLACASTLPRPAFEKFDPGSRRPASDYPDAQAVVLLDRGELRFSFDDKAGNPLARLRRWRRLQVLATPDAALHRIDVPVEPTTFIYGLQVRVSRVDGRKTTYADPQTAETGHMRVVRLELDLLQPGDVVDLVYDLWFKDPRFVPPWVFESEHPTLRSEFAVVLPPGFDVDLRFSRDGDFVDAPPDRFETLEGVRFSWSIADLPARYQEFEMPRAALLAPRAHVLFRQARRPGQDTVYPGFATWDEVGRWLVSRQPRWAELTPAHRDEAARVASDLGPEEGALRLLEVVARDVRRETETPLWRAPLTHPDAVLDAGAGTASSRGLLLVALLRAAGYPAVPALYSARDHDILLPDAATVRSLDGIAAALPRPEGWLFLDPSTLTVNGRVPAPQLQGQRVVLVRDDRTEVVRVPLSKVEDSSVEVEYTLQLDARGELFGRMEARLTGAEAGELRAQLLDEAPSAYEQVVSKFLASRGAVLPATSISLADLRVLRRPLLVTGTVGRRWSFADPPAAVVLPLGQLIGGAGLTPREVRRSPRRLGVPRRAEVRMTVTLPDEWSVEVVPEPAALTGPGQTLELSARAETERRIGFRWLTRSTALSVARREHSAFRRYTFDRAAALEQTVVLKRPPERDLRY